MFEFASELKRAGFKKRHLKDDAVADAVEVALAGSTTPPEEFWEELHTCWDKIRNPERLKLPEIIARADDWPLPRESRRLRHNPLYVKLIRLLMALDHYNGFKQFGLPVLDAASHIGLDPKHKSTPMKVWRMLQALCGAGVLKEGPKGTKPSDRLPKKDWKPNFYGWAADRDGRWLSDDD